jgi:hypothetical protein
MMDITTGPKCIWKGHLKKLINNIRKSKKNPTKFNIIIKSASAGKSTLL